MEVLTSVLVYHEYQMTFFIEKLFRPELSSVWKVAPNSIHVSALMVRRVDTGHNLSERQGKRWTGTKIVEDKR